MADDLPAYFLRVSQSARSGPVWHVRWRHDRLDGTRSEPKRSLKVDGAPARAWVQQDKAGEWVPRKGKAPAGHFTLLTAAVAAERFVAQADAELTAKELAGRPVVTRATFREAWKGYRAYLLEEGVTPNTLDTYDRDFVEPGTAHKRGEGKSAGLAMKTLGHRPLKRITTDEIDALLDVYAATPTRQGTPRSPRTVNRLRQSLHAVFEWACIPRNGYGLQRNPVTHARVRKERKDHSRQWWFSWEEVEAIARALERGEHRAVRHYRGEPVTEKDAEKAARRAEDRRDADAVRLTFYTGLRLNELTAMKLRQVRLTESKLIVNRSVSGGIEQERDKADAPGEVPLPDPAIVILDRLLDRPHFLGTDDYLLVARDGSILSGSALNKRFKKALAATELPHQDRSWHTLRHSYGTELVRGGADLASVKDAMRHSKLTTTERYLHARSASEQAKRFTDIFAKATAPPVADPRTEKPQQSEQIG